MDLPLQIKVLTGEERKGDAQEITEAWLKESPLLVGQLEIM